MYHVPGCPDYGIGVLRKGLSIAGESWAIANDLAYILRDEHRYEQAIDAFSLLIEKEPDYLLHYSYSERARLYGQLGLREEQERDEQMVESLARSAYRSRHRIKPSEREE